MGFVLPSNTQKACKIKKQQLQQKQENKTHTHTHTPNKKRFASTLFCHRTQEIREERNPRPQQ
jgi:hypothetical protein